ncbi:beta-D-glucosyl crocetin beta-1,6-glucosyltransferase [Artemisia annua]|uniref:Glycosyltransferase n=1 Tax=Artemisia annua TaxID=35608 RepID=A0A2U1PHY5_ARTAN|nr:beta-D-glucosyl crocetin beta-1,6-glucosyltransferase [Artemisia annua]
MKKQTVLMFPWLGHGHISPFLELAKKLSNTNLFNISLCSTPTNLDLVKKTLRNECVSHSIQLIELNLTPLPDLPPQLHTTNGLPAHLMPTLKQAFDNASPQFTKIMKGLSPDLLIYDIIQPWAPLTAANLGIPAVVLITTSAAASMYHFYLNYNKDQVFPFSKTIFYRNYEYVKVANSSKDKEEDRIMQCVAHSSDIVLVKSFDEIEGKYAAYLSVLTSKKVVPVGPLVANPIPADMKQNSVIQWLDTKAPGSTVFVSFGSEYFLSSVDLQEIAYGLELSNVNFIWVLRFPKGESKVNVSEALPLGFIERVKNRGLLVEGWAPQAKILKHKSIGGFVSHCGWNSVLEAMKYGVPIIAMPMHLDQPINARLVVDVGVGVEVVRVAKGLHWRDNVAKVVKHVVVSMLGQVVREKAKKLSLDMRTKGDEEIDELVKELLQLCKTGSSRRGRSYDLQKTKSEGFPIDNLSEFIHVEEEGKQQEESIDVRAAKHIIFFYEELKRSAAADGFAS